MLIHLICEYIGCYKIFIKVCYTTSLCNCCLTSNINLVLLGTYVIGIDPRFDPFCVWGNEILMNLHQVKKLIKIVSKMGQNMAIKLFVYTWSNTTTNRRMVSKNSAAFFLLRIMSRVRWQCLNLFSFEVVPKAVY